MSAKTRARRKARTWQVRAILAAANIFWDADAKRWYAVTR
jgi:hypothetical protein